MYVFFCLLNLYLISYQTLPSPRTVAKFIDQTNCVCRKQSCPFIPQCKIISLEHNDQWSIVRKISHNQSFRFGRHCLNFIQIGMVVEGFTSRRPHQSGTTIHISLTKNKQTYKEKRKQQEEEQQQINKHQKTK